MPILKNFLKGAASALGIGFGPKFGYLNPTTALAAAAGHGIIKYASTRIADYRRNKLNKEMADYAHKKSLQAWQMQNQYNSPEAQMQRYQEAGLNPHLMYGQGTPGNATGIAQYNAPVQTYNEAGISPLDMLGSYQRTMQAEQDIRLTQSQAIVSEFEEVIRNNRANQSLSEEQIASYEAQIAYAVFDGRLEERKAQIAENIARSSIEQKRAEWARMGLNPNDATWVRYIVSFMQQQGVSDGAIGGILSLVPGGSLIFKGIQAAAKLKTKKR